MQRMGSASNVQEQVEREMLTLADRQCPREERGLNPTPVLSAPAVGCAKGPISTWNSQPLTLFELGA